MLDDIELVRTERVFPSPPGALELRKWQRLHRILVDATFRNWLGDSWRFRRSDSVIEQRCR